MQVDVYRAAYKPVPTRGATKNRRPDRVVVLIVNDSPRRLSPDEADALATQLRVAATEGRRALGVPPPAGEPTPPAGGAN